MARNKLFVPQDVLDGWLVDGAADMQGQEILVKSEQRRYRLAEGVHIVREVTGESDPNELVGKCKTHAFLRELGAEVVETSMILDDNAYDVVPGFIGTPVGPGGSSSPPRPELTSDEQLLAEFLARKM
ncbi:MAG TPA: hypothetical protein PLI95_26275 [Polyangiaceae bacterium]|nr:hypothetical protein [Polyangiaceae bacterium]